MMNRFSNILLAQPADRVRRIGVLMNRTAEDPAGQAGSVAFADKQ